ncbi:hypothetical protein [Desertibacillus haloalkaliphilus]|uniref:hypothetical protein n=1 Tax=Desertibacillus haloalkaliphilus TaxID=1328930 RepID=UPI001C25BB4F|nr:hypothetical protein [Desertibacillus haloalkaliphilus]MBU8908098.1 hypothetical protein [Desertibacillus haloalkaliphilus]
MFNQDKDSIKQERKKDIIEVIKPYKEHISTVDHWKEFSKSCGLPSYGTIINYFGSWNQFKKELDLTINKPLSDEELLSIADKFRDHFTTAASWYAFAKKHNLPSAQAYIDRFGSWNEVKHRIGLSESKKSSIYNKEQIIKVLMDHKSHLTTKENWNTYVRNHTEQLPTYETIIKYISWNNLKDTLDIKDSYYTNDDLIKIAKENKEHFTTIKKWDEFAKQKKLPLAITFYRRFGKWKDFKSDYLENN